MLYLYDQAIVRDLERSFNASAVDNPVVRVVDPNGIIGLAAQIQNDDVSFPIVALSRNQESIDSETSNFTRIHQGVEAVIDPETNLLYYERVVPLKLNYKLTVLTTNKADMDELIKELVFKYYSMYFLTLVLPYECKRKVRFGITLDRNSDIEESSGHLEYIQNGQLYQSVLSLNCEGCVLVSYTPAKLQRVQHGVDPVLNRTNLMSSTLYK